MGTQVALGANGLTATWAADFALNYKGYWIYGIAGRRPHAGAEPEQLWQLGGKDGHKFGRFQQEFQDCVEAIDDYAVQDNEHDVWGWYCGSEFRSEANTTHVRPDGTKVFGELHDCDSGEVFRWDNTAGPGSAKEAAYAYYKALCKEPGANGMVWVGRLRPGVDGQPDTELEEETCELDAAQQEEDRQAAYEDYLERNHDAIVQQERYEMFAREY
jgi:hypothetical protein